MIEMILKEYLNDLWEIPSTVKLETLLLTIIPLIIFVFILTHLISYYMNKKLKENEENGKNKKIRI